MRGRGKQLLEIGLIQGIAVGHVGVVFDAVKPVAAAIARVIPVSGSEVDPEITAGIPCRHTNKCP